MEGILDPEYFSCYETEMVLAVKRDNNLVRLKLRANSILLDEKELDNLIHQLVQLKGIIKRDKNL